MSAAQEVVDLLRIPLARDEQRLVGPSDLSNYCTYCLAKAMLKGSQNLQKYWLGARIGTAIHHEMETLVTQHRPETKPESRVTVGEIPGYGVITGTSDWLVGDDVRDFKTTTRDKLVWIKRAIQEEPDPSELSKITEARFKVETYWNQLSLYGLGVENAGEVVSTLTLIFICRDGKTSDDVWSKSLPYDRSRAEKVLDRAQRLWEYLSSGEDIEDLVSHESCYTCSVEGRM